MITEADVDYEGSIEIPRDLMDAADLWAGEKVLVASITTGARLETYVLEGAPGTGKTMTAAVLAHELSLPLLTIRLVSFFRADPERIRPVLGVEPAFLDAAFRTVLARSPSAAEIGSTGTPISLLVRNADQRPGAYDEMRDKFRPSHADYTYQAKFGIRDHRGGGRSSARETVGRVAAGAIASTMRLPYTMRLNTSRPSRSTPKRNNEPPSGGQMKWNDIGMTPQRS